MPNISVLDPAGPQAERIATLYWGMVIVCGAVFVVVMVLLAVAIMRPASQRDEAHERRLELAIRTGVGATVVILFGILTSSFWTGRALAALDAPQAVSIAITGRQWWWEVEYEDAVPERRVTTANEIHIPVGRPVVLKVTSRDVIHSFWAPSLHGKRDLIPGYTTAFWIQADRSGVYPGQCAEFCGRQHAHMAFDVVAETSSDFFAWLAKQRETAAQPGAEARAGFDLFITGTCSGCHTVRGTPANGRLGPDLTHLASRRTIGARTLPNRRDALHAWTENVQAFKPAARMPPHSLDDRQLQAVVAYLETLQ